MKRIEEIKLLLKNSVITKDQYQNWLDNVTTKRFFLEIEEGLLEMQSEPIGISSYDCAQIALKTAQKDEHIEVLTTILEWNPVEDSVDE